jgi:hypothetical protein
MNAVVGLFGRAFLAHLGWKRQTLISIEAAAVEDEAEDVLLLLDHRHLHRPYSTLLVDP